MKNLSLERIAAVCGAEIHGAVPPGEITAVVTDSRAVTPGCLFAAIRGERSDGHDYIGAALSAGAKCALAERVPEGVTGCVLLVEDTLRALQTLAGFYRAQFALPLVGVTGSVGKTTAKEMLACVLARRFRVHKTQGNFNNDLGVPLTLFGLREEHSAAVVELGVSHPGDMDRIAALARPTVALYTNIGDAHLEFLGSRAGVLAEKSRMNAFLPPDGLAVCNGDDPLLAGMDCPVPKLCYGLGAWCDVRAEDVETDGEEIRCTVVTERTRFALRIPAFGEHMVYAALGAAAVGMALGLRPEEIAAGVADYVPVGSRCRVFHTDLLRVIDDCYNANPTSTAAALRSLAALPGRKVAILGDMRELGDHSAALHRETGELARRLGIDLVLSCGPEATHIAEGAGDIALDYPIKRMLLAALPYVLQAGDTVLVKASRGARFEEVTRVLEHLALAEGPELWDLCDASGRPTGETRLRGLPLHPGEYHKIVHVWLRSAEGAYLLSQRAETRPTDPLLWESVGGSVLAGETGRAAAVREVWEELGVRLDDSAGTLLLQRARPEWFDYQEVWLFPYAGEADLRAAPTEEVRAARWVSRDELEALYRRGELAPTLEYILRL